jgi:DNA-binding response OmpR family regulator
MPANQQKTICIIDDDSIIVSMYRKKFELDGFKIVTASNGIDGLKVIKQEKPDIVLLDIVMPKLDGLGLLKQMRALREIAGIPVIILTNLDSPKERRSACELGALFYLPKSDYLPKEVLKLVKEILVIADEKSKKIAPIN